MKAHPTAHDNPARKGIFAKSCTPTASAMRIGQLDKAYIFSQYPIYMKTYVLEDGFEFVVNNAGTVIKTRVAHENYQNEDDGIKVIGSIPERVMAHFGGLSYPPKVGEYLVVKGNSAPPSPAPVKISFIESKSSLVERVKDLFRNLKE